MIKNSLIALLLIGICSCTVETNEETGNLETVVGNPMTARINAVENVTTKMQVKLLESQEKARLDRYNAEKVKVYVRGRDVKTCMRILKINEIDNEVTECTNSRNVEMRRDEVEAFKLANEI